MFEDGDQNNKNNKENENKKDSTKINNNISINENNNKLETEFKQEKAQKEKMDVISENYELNEQEKSESESDKNISIEDKCFYLIKWNTSEYSLELDSFMETFPNFKQILSNFNTKEAIKEKEKVENYLNEKDFKEKISQILIQLGFTKKNENENLINNSFIYKTKEELFKYKKNIISIILKLFNNNKENKNKYLPHILILNDDNNKNNNNENSLVKLLENNNLNYLNLLSNKQTFIYECINFSEDLFSHNELNILRIKNHLYLHKNKENILKQDNIKRFVSQNILIDNIDSKNISYMQEYHFDLIIFDLKNIKSLLKLREYFQKINSPLNTNYEVLKYILLEQSDSSNFDKVINNFFNLFYNKEDTILLYGNYSGKNKNQKWVEYSEEEKDNLKLINLIPNNTIQETEEDLDPFHYQKNFINLNYSTILYNDSFNGLIINNIKWALYLNKNEFHYIQILSSLTSKYDIKIFSLRSKDYNEIIMNFIPIYLDKETFIQYLYIIKNKPEVLYKTQENKKDLMQNILLLCSLPSCMTKFYKKYLEDYKLPIKDNINYSKTDVFYQLSRILLSKTKGKIIIIFPLHDKVYRDNEPLLRKIRKEIEKIFFSNINPENKEINIAERKKNFFCFLMDEEGLFEEIKKSEKAKYPTNIIIFNMFLQNKNTGEFFNFITKNKFRHKIILYQLYISNLIEGKLSQIFYSKLDQFIEICTSPLKKMKTTVYGQLTLIDKEIITISDLKKIYEKEISNINDDVDRNDINKINIITSYQDLIKQEKKIDGFIYVQKNSYLICTNSNYINLKFDYIYNTFVGNISFNNFYENNLLNNGNNKRESNEEISGKNKSGIENYNKELINFQKNKFSQELDFLKDESNFENLKTNKYDLTSPSKGNNENNNNVNNTNGNGSLNMNFTLSSNGPTSNHNINLGHNHINSTRGEEVYILNDSSENFGNPGQKRKKGRKRKNEINNNNNNNANNNANSNNNRDLIQIPNDEENEEMNSVLSDDIRSNNNNGNNPNIINNPITNNINNDNTNNN